MSIKRKLNPLKILTAFVAALIATIFGFSPSKAQSNPKEAPSAQTIEQRLAKVREQMGQRGLEALTVLNDKSGDKKDQTDGDPRPQPSPSWGNGSDPNGGGDKWPKN